MTRAYSSRRLGVVMLFNALDMIQSFAVALPVFTMMLVAIAVVCGRVKQLAQRPTRARKRRRIAISAAIGLCFLSFASIYRPNLIEVAKAQIHLQEEANEDDNGDPENSPRNLHRQLRRIRKGEKVETSFLRRE